YDLYVSKSLHNPPPEGKLKCDYFYAYLRNKLLHFHFSIIVKTEVYVCGFLCVYVCVCIPVCCVCVYIPVCLVVCVYFCVFATCTYVQHHGLAVCLVLTTMCTSLLLVYSSLGSQKERPPQQQQQQQQQLTMGSEQPVESSPQPRRTAPAGHKPLDGYLGVTDHKQKIPFQGQEMTQKLKAATALAKDSSQFPTPTPVYVIISLCDTVSVCIFVQSMDRIGLKDERFGEGRVQM
ncbi:hypothetical protein STEG23_004379, partial [Scotinomys teguina]